MTDRQASCLPALEGDTISFSSTGYISRTVVIPSVVKKENQPRSAMSRDTVMINDAYLPLAIKRKIQTRILSIRIRRKRF